nr:reverse transcriptase domain, reverse transcriptase zinc-binding domain protein [Tanacetum cinerariifolium]
MSVYYFSAFKALKKIIHKLEGIRRRFFWGGNTEVDKVAWIAGDKALLLRTNGGLEIGSLKASNQSLLSKWWCRFLNKDTAFLRKLVDIPFSNPSDVLTMAERSTPMT